MIRFKKYLDKLFSKKENGLIKVILALEDVVNLFLLFNIYHEYLTSIGIADDHIIELSLDDDINIKYRNPIELGKYIRSKLLDKGMHYVFLDEIQKVKTIKNPYIEDGDDKISFVDTLLGLMKLNDCDVYVTGSNSKMLSSDIITEFRGRADQIEVHPLSFFEFFSAFKGDKHDAWKFYWIFYLHLSDL